MKTMTSSVLLGGGLENHDDSFTALRRAPHGSCFGLTVRRGLFSDSSVGLLCSAAPHRVKAAKNLENIQTTSGKSPRGCSESHLVYKQQYMAPSFGLLGDSCCVQRKESRPFMTAFTGSLPESRGFG
jgi:hypothetical protein